MDDTPSSLMGTHTLSPYGCLSNKWIYLWKAIALHREVGLWGHSVCNALRPSKPDTLHRTISLSSHARKTHKT
ncbi:hypothetical protein L1887_26540 [Cichorium endivia]|nr:hypothetical protein L1887_26540 [Cichorium endivia]